MRKFFGLIFLVLVLSLTVPEPTQTHDTGPPGTAELVVPFDAEMQAETINYATIQMGDYVFSPGDSYTQGHELFTDLQFSYALHSDNSYNLQAPESAAIWQPYRQSKTSNLSNRHIDPGRWYHNKA